MRRGGRTRATRLTLVASALAGGDCIDDADVLRTGGTAQTLGCVVKAPSTLGTFLRSFRWGHPPIGSGQPGAAGPGLVGWGRTRRRAIHHRPGFDDLRDIRSGQGGGARPRLHGPYHPLLAGGTGDVLMARLREGRANTARGAAHFLRWGGCATPGRGQLTVRADSGFYTHAIVAACRRMDVRFSITIRQSASLRSLIEAIPEQDWTPLPYWMEGAADVAETEYLPSRASPTPRRCGSSSGA